MQREELQVAKSRGKEYPGSFRTMALERMKSCDNIGALAAELGIHRRLLYKWRDMLEPCETGPAENSHEAVLERENARLKRLLAEKMLEVDFFKRGLAASRIASPSQQRVWREGIYAHIRGVMPAQGRLSIERMCHLAEVGRAGFYRRLAVREPEEEEMEVRSAIQSVVLEHRRRCGYRRVAAELRRRGMAVNHKPGSPRTGLRPWGGSAWRV